jgi:GT2 family glycosyltransferase
MILYLIFDKDISLKFLLKTVFRIPKICNFRILPLPNRFIFFRILIMLINFLTYVRYSLTCIFSNKPHLIYCYIQNDALINIDKETIDVLIHSKHNFFYGDSLVKCHEDTWYEARPVYSRKLHHELNYFGDIFFSKTYFDNSLELLKFVFKSCNPDLFFRIDKAIGIRESFLLDAYGVPVLFDKFRLKNSITINSCDNNSDPVSIIIPTAFKSKIGYGIQNCLKSIYEMFQDRVFEIILVFHYSNQSGFDELKTIFSSKENLFSETYQFDFNFSAVVNRAVARSSYDRLLILNDDILISSTSDLGHLLCHLSENSRVGCVGVKITDHENRLKHAGIIFSNGAPENFLNGSSQKFMRLAHDVCREVTGITGALILTSKSVFNELNGLDENFPLDYNDVDYMLRLRENNYEVIFCSKFNAMHFESMSRGESPLDKLENDLIYLRSKHIHIPLRDSYLFTPATRLNN